MGVCLRKTFRHKRQKITGRCRKLYTEKLHNSGTKEDETGGVRTTQAKHEKLIHILGVKAEEKVYIEG
jgi:hypothetical protein